MTELTDLGWTDIKTDEPVGPGWYAVLTGGGFATASFWDITGSWADTLDITHYQPSRCDSYATALEMAAKSAPKGTPPAIGLGKK